MQGIKNGKKASSKIHNKKLCIRNTNVKSYTQESFTYDRWW